MASRVAGSFRLFRALGVDVFVHWSWFLVALIQYQLATGNGVFSHPAWHAAVYLSLFGIVTLHEFGHALACKSVGGRADTIVLWPLGGVAFVQPPQRPGATLWSIAAGPLVNVLLVPVTFAATWTLVGGADPSTWTDLQWYVVSLTFINTILLLFNMLPIYPLDGGQIFQALLWFVIGQVRSLKVAASFGLVFAVLGALAVVIFDPPFLSRTWTLILAAFVAWQAWSGLQYARQLGHAEARWRTGQLPDDMLPGSHENDAPPTSRRDDG